MASEPPKHNCHCGAFKGEGSKLNVVMRIVNRPVLDSRLWSRSVFSLSLTPSTAICRLEDRALFYLRICRRGRSRRGGVQKKRSSQSKSPAGSPMHPAPRAQLIDTPSVELTL